MGKRWLCGVLLVSAPFCAGADAAQSEDAVPSDPPLSTVRTQYFEIVGPDGASSDFAGRVCTSLVEVAKPWMRLPIGFSNRIFLRLQPGTEYAYDDPFRARIGVAGNVEMRVRWERTSELQSLERAAARALLLRLALWNRIPADGIAVPAWIEAGLQRSVRARGNPAYIDGMAGRMREQGPLPLREILRGDRGSARDERFADNAYWLLRHLEHHSGRSNRLHNLVIRLLGGGDPQDSLMATFGAEIEAFERAELWWAVGLHDRIQRRALTQSPFHDSRRLIRSLQRFSYRKDGRELRLGLGELWEYRDEPAVRSEVVRRVERINYEMRSIHPFHFNAVLSLGRAMVALNDGDETDFRRQVALFEEDAGEAERLFRETEEALDRLEAELDSR